MVIPKGHEMGASQHAGMHGSQHPGHHGTMHLDEEQPLLSWRSQASSRAKSTGRKHHIPQWVYVLVCMSAVFCWVTVGVWVGMEAEGWGVLTSLYVTTQIITTVGYGDITVTSKMMKIFMSFYVIGCLIFVSYVINKFAEHLLQKNSNFFKEKAESLQNAVSEHTPRPPMPSLLVRLGPLYHALFNLAIASSGFIFWVAIGTIFYATYEKCSCSYGITKVDGCVDGEMCASTGGFTKTWIDAYYMSVITLTSVGFGDHTPRSYYGRIFGVIWMIMGVISTATWVGSCADFFFEVEKGGSDTSAEQLKFNKEVFQQMDKKHKGYVTRDEFIEFMLLKYNLVDAHDLKTISALFADVDKDDSGTVDIEEVDKLYGVRGPGTGLADIGTAHIRGHTPRP